MRHDARGHGESGKPPGPYSLEMMAGDVVGLLDALDIEQVHICGVSMGGMIAQTVALDHPDRVASIALVNTTSEYSDDQLQAWRDRAASFCETAWKRCANRFWPDGLPQRPPASSPGYVYMAEMIGRFSAGELRCRQRRACAASMMPRLPEVKCRPS